MNIPRHQVEERLAYIRTAAATGLPLSAVTDRFALARNNVRELMHRHGIELPATWLPRPTRKTASRLSDDAALMPDQVGDPASLTEDERGAAEALGIAFERAAWLVTCEAKGTAYGLRITR